MRTARAPQMRTQRRGSFGGCGVGYGLRSGSVAALLTGLVAIAGCRAAATPPADAMASAVAYSEGDTAAPVQVIYFDDYACDDCATFSKEAVEPLHRDWVQKGRARLTIVDLAWHRGSVAGAAAASCAAEQGKFWPMHTLLFERQAVWMRVVDIPAQMVTYASELGMDTTVFRTCALSKRHQARLDAAEDVTRRYAVRGTPAFVVNGRLYYGSQQWSWVRQVLAANERGEPDAAPPPPLKVPTKKVVDSARLRAIEDSLSRARGSGAASQ